MSARIYAYLLTFYPEDLRRDHGAEMVFVFAEDLAAARCEAGIRGLLRVWRWTVGEFARIALPCWLSTSAVRVHAISLAVFVGMVLSLLPGGAARTPNAHPVFYGLRFALLLPLFSTPFICLAVFCACRGSRFASTTNGVSGAQEHPPCLKLDL
jgi:hypothetical protein